MMNERGRQRTAIALMIAGTIAICGWILVMHPEGSIMKLLSSRKENSPTAGQLAVAVDRSLVGVALLQTEVFAAHYPDAGVSIETTTPDRTMLRLLKREIHAILVNGKATALEDSLLNVMKHPPSREIVARSAWVCIVNPENPIAALSVESLRIIVTGKLSDWKTLGGGRGPLKLYVAGDDVRLQSGISTLLLGRAMRFAAVPCRDEADVAAHVAAEPGALGIIPLSSTEVLSGNGAAKGGFRVLSLSQAGGQKPVEPSQFAVYAGEYPLSALVYYLYDSSDPLARGFGSWLTKEGQKTFERSTVAPFRREARTIILK